MIRRVHYSVPFQVASSGYYLNTACGAHVYGMPDPRTADTALVTCRGCQRTRCFKRADNKYYVKVKDE